MLGRLQGVNPGSRGGQVKSQDHHAQGFSLVVSKILRERRRDAGFSQRALAERVGVTAASICYYESGKRVPSLTTFMKLKCALEFSLRDCITIIEVLNNEEGVDY